MPRSAALTRTFLLSVVAIGFASCGRTHSSPGSTPNASLAGVGATIAQNEPDTPPDLRGALVALGEFVGAEGFFSAWQDLEMPDFPPDADMVPRVEGRTYLRYGAHAHEADAQGLMATVPIAVARQVLNLLIGEEGGSWVIGFGETNCYAAAAVESPEGDGILLAATSSDWDSTSSMLCRLRREVPVVLPEALGDWSRDGDVAIYDTNTIFDLIDGAAEPHLRYNMVNMRQARYVRGDQSLQVSVFDMGSAEDALGLLTRLGVGEPAWAGQAALASPRQLQLWQGPYYVEVRTLQRDANASTFLLEFAQELRHLLGPEGPLPAAVRALGATTDDISRLRFFHQPSDQESFFYLSTGNPLRLDAKTDGAMLKLSDDERPPVTMAIYYRSAEDLASAASGFWKVATLEAETTPGDQAFEWEPGGFCAVRALEDEGVYLLLAVIDAPSAEEALGTLDRLANLR